MSTTCDTQCTVKVIKSPKVGAQENAKEGQPFKLPSLLQHPIHLIPVQKGSHRNVIYMQTLTNTIQFHVIFISWFCHYTGRTHS